LPCRRLLGRRRRLLGQRLNATGETLELGNALLAVQVLVVIGRDLSVGKLPGS